MSKRSVWKYPIPWPPKDDEFELALPTGSTVLTVQTQHGNPMMWVFVPGSTEVRTRRFRIAGTGHPIDGNVRYIATFQQAEGFLVWHVFELDYMRELGSVT